MRQVPARIVKTPAAPNWLPPLSLHVPAHVRQAVRPHRGRALRGGTSWVCFFSRRGPARWTPSRQDLSLIVIPIPQSRRRICFPRRSLVFGGRFLDAVLPFSISESSPHYAGQCVAEVLAERVGFEPLSILMACNLQISFEVNTINKTHAELPNTKVSQLRRADKSPELHSRM